MAVPFISQRALRGGTVAPAMVLAALVLGIGVFEPSFLSSYSLLVLIRESGPILLLALAQTTVIMLGGIDLSVAAVASLTSVLLALLLPQLGVLGLLAVLLLATGIGAAQGYVHVVAQNSIFRRDVSRNGPVVRNRAVHSPYVDPGRRRLCRRRLDGEHLARHPCVLRLRSGRRDAAVARIPLVVDGTLRQGDRLGRDCGVALGRSREFRKGRRHPRCPACSPG